MIWWQWVVLGALLLGSELMLVDAGFYLVFLGASALLMGAIGLAGVPLSVSVEWLVFSALSIVTLVLFRGRLYQKLRGEMPEVSDGVVGEIAIARETIAPGGQGVVRLRGSDWTAHNVGAVPIPEEARSRVESISGATVSVRFAD